MVLRTRRHEGYTVLELMISMVLMLIVMAGAITYFTDSTHRSYDHDIMTRAEETARMALEIMASDLVNIGGGMPLFQTDFMPGGSGLGDAPLPILTTATATFLPFRSSDKGILTYLASDYTPSGISLSFDVSSDSDFAVGDIIYLSNLSAGGSDGMRAEVDSISSDTITVSGVYVASSGATFKAGSTVARVTDITYSNSVNGIVRDGISGSVILAPDSSFTASYQDSSGNALSLPLSNSEISSSLARIVLTVTVNGKSSMKSGGTYQAVASKIVALRSLNLAR